MQSPCSTTKGCRVELSSEFRERERERGGAEEEGDGLIERYKDGWLRLESEEEGGVGWNLLTRKTDASLESVGRNSSFFPLGTTSSTIFGD